MKPPRKHGGGHPPRLFTGREFGRLTVLGEAAKPLNCSRTGKWWTCRCSCAEGTVRPIYGDALASGGTKSCGCIRREKASGLGRRWLGRTRDGRRGAALAGGAEVPATLF